MLHCFVIVLFVIVSFGLVSSSRVLVLSLHAVSWLVKYGLAVLSCIGFVVDWVVLCCIVLRCLVLSCLVLSKIALSNIALSVLLQYCLVLLLYRIGLD